MGPPLNFFDGKWGIPAELQFERLISDPENVGAQGSTRYSRELQNCRLLEIDGIACKDSAPFSSKRAYLAFCRSREA